MGLYAVITADIIQSRKLELPVERIEQTLASFAGEHLVKSFALSRGDEIQGVTSDLSVIVLLVRRLRYVMRPLAIRVGMSIGEIEDDKLKKAGTSWDLSGEVFFSARAALDMAKKSRVSNTFFLCSDDLLSTALNTSLSLLETIESGWTEKQWQAVHVYEREGTYEKAARVLGVTAPAVQQHCDKAGWNVVRAAEKELAKLISLSLRI